MIDPEQAIWQAVEGTPWSCNMAPPDVLRRGFVERLRYLVGIRQALAKDIAPEHVPMVDAAIVTMVRDCFDAGAGAEARVICARAAGPLGGTRA